MFLESGRIKVQQPNAEVRLATDRLAAITGLQVRALPGANLSSKNLRKFGNLLAEKYRTITGQNRGKENVLNCDHLCIDTKAL
jgi:hypothetical protein